MGGVMLKFLTIALLIAMSVCQAGTIDPSVSDQKYLEYGEKHECVVPIHGDCNCGEHDGKPHQLSASAVVIGKRWIVTAAHVVKSATNVRVVVRGKDHHMKRMIVNKDFKEEILGMNDIALGESEEDIDLDFYPELYDSDDEVGKVASICGYGVTGNFSTGFLKSDGKKRAGSNVIDKVENHVMVCTVEGPRKTSLEYMIAPGDSGGGMFIETKLAGINSFVTAADGKPNSDYGDECCHTRISVFAPWIRSTMAGSDENE
jgi:hypothetical protein